MGCVNAKAVAVRSKTENGNPEKEENATPDERTNGDGLMSQEAKTSVDSPEKNTEQRIEAEIDAELNAES